MGNAVLPVTIEGVDIWGDARDATDADATPIVMPPEFPDLPLAHARPGETRKQTWERLRLEARAAGMGKKDAYQYATREVDRVWRPPELPPPPPEPEPEPPAAEVVVAADPPAADPVPGPELPAPPAAADQAAASSPPTSTTPPAASGGVQGLGDIPTSWPTLPANASLAAEVAWVHANRIRVRQGDGVDLSRAISPAPSYAALSWLETSILYPSKWADVTVKASQDQADAAEDVRRERHALVDLQALLAEAASAIP